MRAIYCGGAVEMARFLFHRKLRPVKEKASGKMRIRFFIRTGDSNIPVRHFIVG